MCSLNEIQWYFPIWFLPKRVFTYCSNPKRISNLEIFFRANPKGHPLMHISGIIFLSGNLIFFWLRKKRLYVISTCHVHRWMFMFSELFHAQCFRIKVEFPTIRKNIQLFQIAGNEGSPCKGWLIPLSRLFRNTIFNILLVRSSV